MTIRTVPLERDSNGRFIKGHSLGKRFEKGCTPFNKGLKGYSNNGSYKKGHTQSNTGKTHFKKQGEYFIDDKGYPRTNIGKTKIRYHILKYCEYNNLDKIPNGYVIHHINENKLDFTKENLQMMTIKEHALYHFNNGRREKMMKGLLNYLQGELIGY